MDAARAAKTREGAQRLVDAWPREAHEELARHGLIPVVVVWGSGRVMVRLIKHRGEWPESVMAWTDIEPGLHDLGRLALRGDLEQWLSGISQKLDLALEAEMQRLLAGRTQ
jgi:hypothetical protein